MVEPGEGRDGRQDDYPAAGRRTAGEVVEEVRIPLVEEQVAVAKRVREGRTITVTTRPVAEETTIREPVLRETVTVERVPIGAVIDQMPAMREDGDLTVIPVVEKRTRVIKELVLVEEIHLRRTRREEMQEQTVTRVRTEVEIDGHDTAA